MALTDDVSLLNDRVTELEDALDAVLDHVYGKNVRPFQSDTDTKDE